MSKLIQPEDLAKSGTEHGQQSALFLWAALNRNLFPELKWLHAIPNGGQRSKTTAALLRAEGVRPGVSDVFLPVPRHGQHGLYIEMKAGKNKPTPEQIEFMAFVSEQGYRTAVCWTWLDAVAVICEYLN
jgi:hypothetical protein